MLRRILPALLAAACCWPALAVAAETPNVVLVLFDDLGYGQPAPYAPRTTFKMPHLEQLARDGVRFSDAHSAAAVCTPTRYGLLTGRYPFRIRQFGVLTTYSEPIIPPSRLTLASYLKRHGYETACVGKWHLGLVWEDGKPGRQDRVPVGARLASGPLQLGFDYFCGFTHARNIGTIIEQDRVAANVAAEENQPLMIDKAIAWLDQRADSGKPFFLYFPMCPPHTPIAPSEEFTGRSNAADLVGQDPKYGDWILQGDAMLGRILDALDRHGVSENTLVIVASDNGAEHRAYPPLRDSKRSIYEGGHRVPLLVRWPGRAPAGTTCDATVCLNDVFATLAEVIGDPPPASAAEDSVSFLPLLRNPSGTAARQETIHQSSRGDLAIREGPWKLIEFRQGKQELYHLQQDLGETRDVLEQHPEAAARLLARLREIQQRD